MTPISSIWLKDRADELKASIAFCTRVPLPRATPQAAKALAKSAWAFPVAGLIVGLIGAAVYVLAHRLGVPVWPAAALSVVATLVVTGALHEDGLADVADGFGGGRDREAKLAILRDSRIGTYGAVALVLGLLLRVAALAALARPSPYYAGAALALAGAVARSAALAPLVWLPPARPDGAGSSAATFAPRSLRPAAVTLAALALALGLELGVVRALFAFVVAAAVTRLFAAVARRHIGGQTGDVCGAAAALAEIAALLALLIGGRDA
jgi:adenosylcobinamide-GDP ribazoletransferase